MYYVRKIYILINSIGLEELNELLNLFQRQLLKISDFRAVLMLAFLVNPNSPISFQMYTTYINGYDKAVNTFMDTMKENLQFANLVNEFHVSFSLSSSSFSLQSTSHT